MNQTPTLTAHLKALMLGGAVALASQTSSQAAALPAKPVEKRVEILRQRLAESPAAGNILEGKGRVAGEASKMWWRNAWGNGGWHNWHNGWHNGGYGWGNWHNL